MASAPDPYIRISEALCLRAWAIHPRIERTGLSSPFSVNRRRLVMNISKRVKILITVIGIPLLFVIAFILVIAAYNSFHKPPEVDLMATGFVPQKIEITEGETIHFVNRSSTITQVLCLGTDKRCDLYAELPRGLKSPGIRIAPDQADEVVFDFYGTFHITSTTVPGMNLTVTVDAAA
jgi:plastocyanin